MVCTLPLGSSSEDRANLTTLVCGHTFHAHCIELVKDNFVQGCPVDECPCCEELEDNTAVEQEEETQVSGATAEPGAGENTTKKRSDLDETQPWEAQAKKPEEEKESAKEEEKESAKEAVAPRFGSPKQADGDAASSSFGPPKQPGGDAEGVALGGLQLVVADKGEVGGPAQQALGGEHDFGQPKPEVAKCHFCTVEQAVTAMKLGGRGEDRKYKCKACAKVDTVWPSVPMESCFIQFCRDASWCVGVLFRVVIFTVRTFGRSFSGGGSEGRQHPMAARLQPRRVPQLLPDGSKHELRPD